jgi:uncharacterized protein
MKYKKSCYLIYLNPIDDVKNLVLLFSTRTSTILQTTQYILDKILSDDFSEIEAETLDLLFNSKMIVPVDENEYNSILYENAIKNENKDTLNFTIQPTSNCQLGCHYCGQNHSKNNLTRDIEEKIVDRIEYFLKIGSYKFLNITWFGGEPLMGFSNIKRISIELLSLAKKYNLFYSANIVTNGLSLKRNIFEELVSICKITAFQITIDGPSETHDLRRITKSGQPTFEIIIQNIVDVVESDFYKENMITVRCNVDKRNHLKVNELLDFFVSKELQGKINFYIAPISDWGGNTASKEVGFDKKTLANLEIDWFVELHAKGFNIKNKLIPKRKYSVCMVTDKQSEVYDAFGNIYPCWEFPYTDKYAGGEYLIGNLKENYDSFNLNAKTRNWINDLDSGSTWCKECNLLPICGGGCPKSWYEGTPPCPTYKSNLKERLAFQFLLSNT